MAKSYARTYIFAMRKIAVVFLLFAAVRVSGATVTVGCPGGSPGTYASITAALAALDAQGPHTIHVSGTCTETVLLDQRERVTIQGPATVAGAGTAPAFDVRDSGIIALRNLTARGTRAAISVANRSTVTLAGIVAENATNGYAIDAFGGAVVNGGGVNAADFVTMRNSRAGMRCERCVAFFSGNLTIENNTFEGMNIDSGRVELFGAQPPSPGGLNIVRNNGNNGINVTNGGVLDLGRENHIQNNAASGILLTTGSIANINGLTIVEGHPRSGIAVLMSSKLHAFGAKVRNNGVVTDMFRSGVSATHNSLVWMSNSEITGTTGRGLTVDSGSTARLDNMTFSGNTELNVRVMTGGIFESIGGNSIPAASVVCDGTAIVFGDLTGIAEFECDKDKKK